MEFNSLCRSISQAQYVAIAESQAAVSSFSRPLENSRIQRVPIPRLRFVRKASMAASGTLFRRQSQFQYSTQFPLDLALSLMTNGQAPSTVECIYQVVYSYVSFRNYTWDRALTCRSVGDKFTTASAGQASEPISQDLALLRAISLQIAEAQFLSNRSSGGTNVVSELVSGLPTCPRCPILPMNEVNCPFVPRSCTLSCRLTNI